MTASAEQRSRRSIALVLGLMFACEPPAPAGSAATSAPIVAPSAAVASAAPAPQGAPPARPAAPALFRVHPGLAALPFRALGHFPTRVEHAAELGRSIGVPALYLKRDDESSPLYGGGKVRKLELLLGDATRAGARRLISFGGAGSHHAVATAAFGRELGLPVSLFLAPQAPSAEVCESLRAALRFGASLRLFGAQYLAVEEAERLARTSEQPAPYLVPPGGTSPLGNIGFVSAAFELREQIRAGQMPEPDVLYTALGSMGSAVGLAVGLEAAGLRTRIAAVRASSPETSSAGRFSKLHDETVGLLRRTDPTFPAVRLDPGRVRFVGDQLGAGYGRPTAAGRAAAARLSGSVEGAAIDAVYTAKAFAGLVAHAGEHAGHTVLFWLGHSAAHLALAPAEDLPPALRIYCPTGD